MILAALSLSALVGTALAAPEDTGFRRYELENFDALELTLPPGWQDAVDEQPGSAELTVELRPENGTGFEFYLTPARNEPAPGRILDAETLRAVVRDAAVRLAPAAGAPVPEVRRLQGADGVGYYFVAAEATPLPGEFACLVQGAMLAGGLVLRFEILTHEPGDPAIALGLTMLQGAVHRDRGLDRP